MKSPMVIKESSNADKPAIFNVHLNAFNASEAEPLARLASVLVLGDPKYYAKSGFKTGHRIDPPYPLPYPEAWMAQAMKSGVLESLKGKVQCVPPLQAEEYW